MTRRPIPFPILAIGIVGLMVGGYVIAQSIGLVVGTALSLVWIVVGSRRPR